MASSEKGATTMREEIAALMHEIWSGWMEYMFQHCTLELIEGKGSNVIPECCVRHWSRQMDTPYDDLSEKEKDSDRRVADKVLALIERHQDPLLEVEVSWPACVEEAKAAGYRVHPVLYGGCTSALVDKKTERLARTLVKTIGEACRGISNRADVVPLDVKTRWLAYIEEDGGPMPADILQCQSCGKPSPALFSWTVEGEMVWLCESCQSTKNLTEAYRKEMCR